jgi:hypothetical protein
MLTPAWYLTKPDFFAGLRNAPQLDPSFDALHGIAELIGDDAGFSPEQTVTATQLALLAAAHLHAAACHGAGTDRLADLVRWLSGLNLLQAQLTQTIQHLARHIDTRALRGLANAPDAVLQAATASLSAAGAYGATTAGNIKQAHLQLHQLAFPPRPQWDLPFSMSQINHDKPGHEGPSCRTCADYQANRERRAVETPMLHGSDGKLGRSPHVSSYLFEATYSRWACTQGAHGPLDRYTHLHAVTSPPPDSPAAADTGHETPAVGRP